MSAEEKDDIVTGLFARAEAMVMTGNVPDMGFNVDTLVETITRMFQTILTDAPASDEEAEAQMARLQEMMVICFLAGALLPAAEPAEVISLQPDEISRVVTSLITSGEVTLTFRID